MSLLPASLRLIQLTLDTVQVYALTAVPVQALLARDGEDACHEGAQVHLRRGVRYNNCCGCLYLFDCFLITLR